ncbi:hypothetical protein EMPS_01904 [Entomortierella parvispora]|uniref:RlpA-like protein double-psi beta-barrel domain-containing protein n=1 Tax=Entomortierella parvispora TaxID=205924 RepID=A0A9P3H4F4_9FUNG|nr:hypothetical protein EMPS_01904 [Entomortierella parvispora]
MKFSQLSVLLMAMIVAVVSVVEASDYQGTHGATNTIKWGHKIKGVSTWFNGSDLKGAACYGDLENNSNVNAQDGWHIGAVPMKFYKDGVNAACFECAKITVGKRSVIVRIIDDCAGCAPNQIDLTASAFQCLAPLSQGVVNHVYEFVRCPSSGSALKWPKSPAPKNN